MLDEHTFHEKASAVLEDLENRLQPVCDEHGFEIESGGGMVTLIFEEPSPARFIVSPNGPARQIWVSALSTSYKFEWDDDSGLFVLDKSREPFLTVFTALLKKQLNADVHI